MKNNYKYQLRGGSKKDICPKCGKLSFTPYVDQRGLVLSPDVGRCDRADKCRYHYTPSEFLKDRGLFIGSNNNCYRSRALPSFTPLIPPQKPDYISNDIFRNSFANYGANPLAKYLNRIFSPLIGSKKVEAVLTQYGVGTSDEWGGGCVFWQIDEQRKIRTGKIMGYDPATGKRKKNPNQFKWVHSVSPDYNLQQCYFGSHLLSLIEATGGAINPQPIVMLMESEKAAVITALALHWIHGARMFIPVACGGCGGFRVSEEKKRNIYDKLQALKGRRVVLFPDNGKFEEWEEQGKLLKGFAKEVYISTLMENKLHPVKIDRSGLSDGDAIDDIILRDIKNGKNADNFADILLTSYGYRGNCKLV